MADKRIEGMRDQSSFWENFMGDPGGYVTGQNTEGAGGIKKMLFGDPDAIKKAYDEAMGRSERMGKETRDFLLGQQAKAQQYYAPIQHMFQSAYGTEGLMAPQVPGGTMGMGPIQSMYGGR